MEPTPALLEFLIQLLVIRRSLDLEQAIDEGIDPLATPQTYRAVKARDQLYAAAITWLQTLQGKA